MKLREITKDLKVGDVFWVKTKITNIGDQNEPLEERFFGTEEIFPNRIFGADVFGDAEVFLGELSQTVIERELKVKEFVETHDKKLVGMVEAYENILFKKKIIIE